LRPVLEELLPCLELPLLDSLEPLEKKEGGEHLREHTYLEKDERSHSFSPSWGLDSEEGGDGLDGW